MKSLLFAPAQLLVCSLVCTLLCGCGGGNQLDTVVVRGTVMYQGKPLPYGTISFQPQAGPPAMGKIQPDGSFTLSTYGDGDGAIVGPHKVLVSATAIDAGTAPEADASTEMRAAQSVIPTKYSSFSTSGLTADVEAGKENQFTFELTGDAPPATQKFDSV